MKGGAVEGVTALKQHGRVVLCNPIQKIYGGYFLSERMNEVDSILTIFLHYCILLCFYTSHTAQFLAPQSLLQLYPQNPENGQADFLGKYIFKNDGCLKL